MTGAPLVSPGAQLGTSTLGRGGGQECGSAVYTFVLVRRPGARLVTSARCYKDARSRGYLVLVNRARPPASCLAASCLLTGGKGDGSPTS